jgi:hypothetical protein
VSDATAQRYQARAFLKALFEYKPATAVVMVMRDGHWSKADAYLSWPPIVERFGGADVYVGCCALARKPGKGSRGKASEAGFLPGAWADVDINGSPIRGSDKVVAGHAPSLEAAIRAIVALAPPALVVHSGYGVQPRWLIEHGLVLRDAGLQRRAERCVPGLAAPARRRRGLEGRLDRRSRSGAAAARHHEHQGRSRGAGAYRPEHQAMINDRTPTTYER